MGEMLKKYFKLSCQLRMLRSINKEIDKYNYSAQKNRRHFSIIAARVRKYNELYDENLCFEMKDGDDT